MPRRKRWRFSPGETRDLAVSMDSELDSDATLTGETPEISAWEGDETSGYEEVDGFTLATPTVNTAALTTEDGETIAIGRGVMFRCTAPETRGTYLIRSECDADDGTHPTRYDELVVEGPGEPA